VATRCDHCWNDMQFAFYHKDCRVWWCRSCSEHFLENGGTLSLLNPGRAAEERLMEPHAG